MAGGDRNRRSIQRGWKRMIQIKRRCGAREPRRRRFAGAWVFFRRPLGMGSSKPDCHSNGVAGSRVALRREPHGRSSISTRQPISNQCGSRWRARPEFRAGIAGSMVFLLSATPSTIVGSDSQHLNTEERGAIDPASNPPFFMDTQPLQPHKHGHRSHRSRKRARSPRRIWLLRAMGVLVLVGIFAALWFWNRSANARFAPQPEDSSISRPE